MFRSSRLRMVVAGGAALALLAGCGSDDDGDTTGSGPETDTAEQEGDDVEVAGEPLDELTPVTMGYVSAVDQMGAAIALDLGFYDDLNLDVELAQPFPTGTDALAALEAGEVDFVQVGTPSIPAIVEGMDLVYLGNYTGSSSQLGIDETMAIVATPDAEISGDNLASLEGKKIGISDGSINQLYLLGLLEAEGLSPDDVDMRNVAPPDMGASLQAGDIDAAVIWDPWPITIAEQVEGAQEVTRGGGYVPFIGYIVSTREYAENNAETVEAVLTARASADHWMRENPDDAADVTTRWVPDTELAVAEEAMQYNVVQLDPRFSSCNYLALDTMMTTLNDIGAVEGTYDPNDHFMPGPILNVMEQSPELFEDLPEIPEEAQIAADYVYKPAEARDSCPDGN